MIAKSKDRKTSITVWIPPEMRQFLGYLAALGGVTMGEAVRTMIRAEMEKHKDGGGGELSPSGDRPGDTQKSRLRSPGPPMEVYPSTLQATPDLIQNSKQQSM